MGTAEVIDYAQPCMKAEQALKNLHNAMLAGNYQDAIEWGYLALTDTKMTINSIKHMQEQSQGVVE